MRYVKSALRSDAEAARRQEFEIRRMLPTLDPYRRQMVTEEVKRQIAANRRRMVNGQ